jgi:hypothetical protein
MASEYRSAMRLCRAAWSMPRSISGGMGLPGSTAGRAPGSGGAAIGGPGMGAPGMGAPGIGAAGTGSE